MKDCDPRSLNKRFERMNSAATDGNIASKKSEISQLKIRINEWTRNPLGRQDVLPISAPRIEIISVPKRLSDNDAPLYICGPDESTAPCNLLKQL